MFIQNADSRSVAKLINSFKAFPLNGRGSLDETTPAKALLDYFYLNLARLNNEEDFDHIRLNKEQMEKTLDNDKFLKYLDAFGVKKMEPLARRCLP
jgi:hypothetical protein